MKYATAYYLFLLYGTVLLRCAIPVVCDAASHLFNEEKHLATVHAVYGNNHLQKQIAADENNKSTSTIKFEEPVSVHLPISVFILPHYLKNNNQTVDGFLALRCLPVYLQQVFSPPKFFLKNSIAITN